MNQLAIINNPALVGTEEFRGSYRKAIAEGVTEFSNWANSAFSMGEKPVASIVLGSGLEGLAKEVELKGTPLQFEEVGIPKPTVEGHKGEFLAAKIQGTPVILQSGRIHTYEATGAVATLAARIQSNFGIKFQVLTSAAGSLDPSIKEGDIVIITGSDISQLTDSRNPSIGLHGESIGGQFPAPQLGYSELLRNSFLKARENEHLERECHSGVYVYRQGPNLQESRDIYQLQKERRAALESRRPDLAPACIGMSMAPEILAIAQFNDGKRWGGFIHCIPISSITNIESAGEPGSNNTILTHEQVLANAHEGGMKILSLCNRVIPKLN